MSQPRVSVIVVSHGRPDLLCRAALSVFHQNHRPVELIIVADHVGLAAISTLPFVSRIKRVLFENENISAARNIGIDHAAAEYIAFLDDDAVAEPMWLSLMLNEMCQHPWAALTGTVLGRNGISVQWGDVGFDDLGRDQPKSGSGPRKLHGTNMLFRADILRQLGGFDEAYRFLYDDTDLAMRLHHAGHETGYLDGELIHHGFAQSARRSARRMPKTLFEIGASYAGFLRRYAPPASMDAALLDFEYTQKRRIERFVLSGDLSPFRIAPLLAELRSGFEQGRMRPLLLRQSFDQAPPFQPLRDDDPQPPVILHGPWRDRHRLRIQAAQHAAAGENTSLFLFHPTAVPHWVRFHRQGYWEQVGGLYGPSRRDQKRVVLWRFAGRVQAETARVASARGFP